MKQELKENQGIPSSLLWTLAIISGVTVANIYYNQPLLNRISRDLNISEFTANLIAMFSQIGYALGLLFIIPLGDLYRRRNIILVNISVLVVSLLTIALAPNIHLILFASLLTGACSVIPQVFMPLAAQYSTPRNQREECGHHPFGIADRYSGFARSEWHRRRIHGLAFHLLRCRRTDDCLPHRHH